MAFHSILFENIEDGTEKILEAPAFLVDLNLDQIIDSIIAKKNEYNLKSFFYTSLKDINEIKYRHEIMRELENKTLFENIKSFAQKMRLMQENLIQANKLYYKYQKESWFLDAVEIYCDAVNTLLSDLNVVALKSRGFLAFQKFISSYIESNGFTLLNEKTKKLKADLASIKYCLLIKGNYIKVFKNESEFDYGSEVMETFRKFDHGGVKNYSFKFFNYPDMNHVEAEILDLVAKLYPDIFLNLDDYYKKNENYLDETIRNFDREIQFYIAYLEYLEKFKEVGLKFCYPKILCEDKEIYNYEGFDLALASKLINQNCSIVCNNFYLKDEERIFVVSGPNQGGKTTFARTFGQLHYLASIGCLVPGREAQLFLFDRIFTHFEKEENIKNLNGKLQDDLVRIHDVLKQATPRSIIIMNEIFSSTTLKDAIFLGGKVMEKIIKSDSLCVCVTFIDELSCLSKKIVSMISTVTPENLSVRTYKIIRKPSDGRAYAISIAEKYGLTYDCIKERVK